VDHHRLEVEIIPNRVYLTIEKQLELINLGFVEVMNELASLRTKVASF
jgi:hypothetical protein